MDRGGTLPELGVIPFGTANDVAKSLKLPIKDIAALAAIAAGERVVGLDVGKIEAAASGAKRSRHFVDSVTIGMDADVLVARGRHRDLKGHLAYVAAIAERAVEQASLDVRVEIDGQTIDARVFNAVINNVPIYAGEMEMPDSKGDDGLLDVYLFNRREYTSKLMSYAIKQVDVLKLGVSELLEDITDNQRSYHGRTIKMRLASPRQVQVDGEVFGETDELTCSIVGRLLVAAH
jgi:diacylglycerol kinase (ATP)